jgi:hypothetical protein
MRCILGRRTLSACILFCAVAFGATFAKAAVIVEAEGLMTVAPVTANSTDGTFAIDYKPLDPDTEVLVVGLYLDNSNTTASTAVTNGIKFAGTNAAHAISSQRAALAYWDVLPADASTTTYQISGTTITGNTGVVIGYYAWELSNVDLSLLVNESIFNTGASASTTGTISTTTDNRLVTNFYGANKQDANSVVNAAGSIVTNGTALLLAGTNTGVIAGGSGAAPTAPGPHTLGWTATGGGSSSTTELAFAFAMPVPEPTSLMLLVGGVLMLAGRRRIVG